MVPRFIGNSQPEPLVQYIARYRHASGAYFNSNGTQIIATIEKDGPALYNISSRFPACVFDDPQYINSCTIKGAAFIGNYDEFIACGSDDFRVYLWKVPGSPNPSSSPFSSPTKPSQDSDKSFQDTKFSNNINNSNNNNNSYNNNMDNNNHTNNNNNTDVQNNTTNNYVNKSDEQNNKVQNHAQSVLLGHRSIVNNVVWNSSLGILCTAGVEKMVKVWSTFASQESDTLPRVYQPRARAPIDFLGELDDESEGTIGESNNTLGLFDLFLQVEEENSNFKRANGGALLRWPVTYGEEEGGTGVTYTFEVQDSDSDSDEEMEDGEEGEEEEEEEEVYANGPGFNFTFEVQDSESSSEEEGGAGRGRAERGSARGRGRDRGRGRGRGRD
eukprot:Phypoly_transcript_04832.p1 GENE.Phypoly_transcript_04832~~Phypoly_transcript_04832.p1  ORF type:complete len:386 (+),score=85.53 Phypoly_transcript_04832:578-1735(+)